MGRRKTALAGLMAAALAGCSAAQTPEPDAAGPKGYILAEIAVTNPEPYQAYIAGAGPLVAKHGGKYLVRGGRREIREGEAAAGRLVILEFASFEAAQAFYDSPEYQAILPMRQANATSRVVIVEGYAP